MSFRDLFRVTPLMKAAFGTVKTSLFSLRTVVFKKPVRFRDDDKQSESGGVAPGGHVQGVHTRCADAAVADAAASRGPSGEPPRHAA